MSEVLGALALLGCVAARVYVGRQARLVAGTDVLFHRSYVQAIRANGHRVPRQLPGIVGPGRSSYPALMHVLLSLFPEPVERLIERHGSFLLDGVLAAGTNAVLADEFGVPPGTALALAGLYLLAPALILVNIGPRACWLTPRVLSQFLYGLLILGALTDEGSLELSAAGIVVLFALLLLTSKFAIQTLLLGVIPFCLMVGSPLPAVLVGAGMAVAFLVSLGFFGRQLVGQLHHLEWYAKRQLRYNYKSAALSGLLAAIRRRDVRLVGEIGLVRNPILAGLLRHIPGFAGLAWYLIDGTGSSGSLDLAAAFFATAVVCWLLTSFGAFRVLGEAERYLEFAVPAYWVLLWGLPDDDFRHVLLGLTALITAVFYVVNLLGLRLYAEQRGPVDRDAIVAAVAGFAPGVLLSLDAAETYAYLGNQRLQVCMWNGQESLRPPLDGFLDWFLFRHPVVHPGHLREIVDRYGVTLIAARKAVVQRVGDESGLYYDLRPFARVFENGEYVLYSRRCVVPGARPRDHERDLVGAQDEDAVERWTRRGSPTPRPRTNDFRSGTRRGVRRDLAPGLPEYDEQVGIDWSWLAADGAMTKAPLGGPKTGPNPTDRAKKGPKRSVLSRARASPSGSGTTAPTATITSC